MSVKNPQFQTEESNRARVWKPKGRILGIPISLMAIWAALYIVASAVPALPVPGMAGMITLNTIMTAISGMILGPAAAIANAAGGIVSMLLFPYGFSAGPLGFLTVTMGGLVAGLLFANKWMLAGIAELLILGSWFVNPKAWDTGMWMVPLPYSAIALLVIFIPPLRNWMRRSILTLQKGWIWPAVFLMCCVGHSAEFMTTNSMTNWLFNLSWQYWVPTLPYWIGVDTVIILISTAVGVSVMVGLKKARLPQFSDSLGE
ncbi:MAG TPA: hypothetical protein VMT46_02485 [Anaerolineaceae bacterium]|nr:hypothetical protein [Anaerolineaceae bacterium]